MTNSKNTTGTKYGRHNFALFAFYFFTPFLFIFAFQYFQALFN